VVQYSRAVRIAQHAHSRAGAPEGERWERIRCEWERLLLSDPILVREFAAIDAEERDLANRRRAAVRRARARARAATSPTRTSLSLAPAPVPIA